MGFYYGARSKLPLRRRKGKKLLPLRGKRRRRLQRLRDYRIGRVYTFCPFSELDDLPEDITLWADDDWSDEVTRHDC